MTESTFVQELTMLINKHSKERGSDTPDYILAGMLYDVLQAFDRTVKLREQWYGRAADAPGQKALYYVWFSAGGWRVCRWDADPANATQSTCAWAEWNTPHTEISAQIRRDFALTPNDVILFHWP